MLEFIASILELFSGFGLDIQEFFFRKNREKRRVLEKEKNLSKKRMISPYQRVGILIFFLVIIIYTGSLFFTIIGLKNRNNRTQNNLEELKVLLEKQKEFSKLYPKELTSVIRRNPLLLHLSKDAWDHDFYYKQLNKGASYELFSLGKEGIKDTEDDVK